MFISFFFELRQAKVPASLREFLTLLEAMRAGVARFDIDEFYYLSRSALQSGPRTQSLSGDVSKTIRIPSCDQSGAPVQDRPGTGQ